MFFTLMRLQYLKSVRSTSFAKSALATGFLVFIALLLLSYVFLAGLFLGRIIDEFVEGQDPISFLNSVLIYFFLFEFMYRYFVQKLPVVDLESLLHLPIGKKKIVCVLLLRSFLSPLNVIALLLFLPFGCGGGAGRIWGAGTGILVGHLVVLELDFALVYALV
ncbi:MAG: DUF5687 family protein [Bacteroidota bacterium]